MAIKNWNVSGSADYSLTTSWVGGTTPIAGDDINFVINLTSSAVVTASSATVNPASLTFSDTTSPFFGWSLTGSSDLQTYGTGTHVAVSNAHATIWNRIVGTAPLIVSSSGPHATLNISGSANTYTGGTIILTGALAVNADQSLGAFPSTLQTSNIVMNPGTILRLWSSSNIFHRNRGIYISGSAFVSSSFAGAPIYYMQNPISGIGQIVFDNYLPSGSAVLSNTSLYLTGVNSYISTTGGVRVDHTNAGYIYASGSRVLGSGSANIEFRNKGLSSTSGGGYLYFYEDPAVQSHTLSSNITWSGIGAATKASMAQLGRISRPQTYNFLGNLVASSLAVSPPIFYLNNHGASPGSDFLIRATYSGNNSGILNHAVIPTLGNASTHFIGSQSLPHFSSVLRSSGNTASNTGSNSANWIFSGSMVLPNRLEPSQGSTGAKLNVANGDVVTATGIMLVTGSTATRYGAGLLGLTSYNAVSFVGRGSWIQQGQVTGSGGLVIDRNSNLTLANNSNAFAGAVLALDNSVLTLASGSTTNVLGILPTSPTLKIQLQNATLSMSSSLSLTSNQTVYFGGTSRIDISPGATLTIPKFNLGSGLGDFMLTPQTTLPAITGGGTVVLDTASFKKAPYYMFSSYPTAPAQLPSALTRSIGCDADIGTLPLSLDTVNIQVKQNEVIDFPSLNPIIHANRGVYLSGTAIFSSSYESTSIPSFYVHSPISGNGQIIFSNHIATGSTTVLSTAVYLTGANSSILTSGGIRIDSTNTGHLYVSGSRNIGSSSIEYRNKGNIAAGGSYLYFFEDPAVQSHILSGDISWTGRVGSYAKYLSFMQGTIRQNQTHVYAGRLITSPNHVGDIYLGYSNANTDKLLTVRLEGNNSGFYAGIIRPNYYYGASTHFVGQQSLPVASTKIRAVSYVTHNTGSQFANWVFSGSMTVSNQLETSNGGANYVGTKLNVASNSIVTHTGKHIITGSLTRQGAGQNVSWEATSFVGPGEWIARGQIVGAGGLVVESGSNVTLNYHANTFTGNVSSSFGKITVGQYGGDQSFGSIPSTPTTKIYLQNSTLVSSTSFAFSNNRMISLTGNNTIDVERDKIVSIPSNMLGTSNINITGGGSLILSGTNNITGSITINDGTVEFLKRSSIPSGSIILNPNGSVILPSGTLSTSSANSGVSFVFNGGTIAIR